MGIEKIFPMETAPKDGTFIFLFGDSGYTTYPFRIRVGRWVPEYRDHWIDVANEAFTDGGDDPIGWAPIVDEYELFLKRQSQYIIEQQKLKVLRSDRKEEKISGANSEVKDWYFTFCGDHAYPNGYVVINGTYLAARQVMFDHFEARWGFQYESKEKAGVDQFHLHEVDISRKHFK